MDQARSSYTSFDDAADIKSLNIAQANKHLRQLQQHVTNTFVLPFRPQVPGIMASGGPTDAPVPFGRGRIHSRQESINEEDLFGFGRGEHGRSEQHSRDENESVIIDENGDKSFELEATGDDYLQGLLPKFVDLAGSSSQSKASDLETKSDEGSTMSKSPAEEIPSEVEFPAHVGIKRSISAIDRRVNFRNSRGMEEVFADHSSYEMFIFEDPEEPRVVRKCRSLPDLIPADMEDLISSVSPNSCPDVTENTESSYSSEELLRQKVIRDSIEGKTIYEKPTLQKNTSLRRSVSINEGANKVQIIDSISEVSDTQEPNCNNKQNLPITKTSSDAPPSPSEAKRQQFQRKSSGYGTGDSDITTSQETGVSLERSTSQGGVSEVSCWISHEDNEEQDLSTADESIHDKMGDNLNQAKSHSFEVCTLGNLVATNLFDDLRSYNPESFGNSQFSSEMDESYFSNSYSSQDDSEQTMDSGNLKSEDSSGKRSNCNSGSSLNTLVGSSSTDGLGEKEKKTKDSKPKDSHCGAEVCDITDYDRNRERPSSNSSQHRSADRGSLGNMPAFLESESMGTSFSIEQMQLEQINHEEERQRQRVIRLQQGGSLPTPNDSPSIETPLSNGAQNYENIQVQHQRLIDMAVFENLLRTRSPTEIIEMLQQRTPSVSPSINQLFSLRVQASGEVLDKKFTAEDFLKSARCSMKNCPEKYCQKFAEIKHILGTDLPDTKPYYELVEQYARLLWQHCLDCDSELQCPVIYCGEVQKWPIRDSNSDAELARQLLPMMQQHANTPLMTCFPAQHFKFYKFDGRFNHLKPREFVTHTPMFRLGQSQKTIVCMEHQYNTMSVLSSYPGLDYKHHLSLYNSKLSQLQHPSIIAHHWLIDYGEDIQVCTPFMQAGSLRDVLTSTGRLSWTAAVSYLQQILNGIIYLHGKLGVVYLNWQSKNMLFRSVDRRELKVSNFGLSCPLQCEMDTGAVKQCLPAHLCPPELLEHKIDFPCDTWGAGCLLHEMVAGSPVYHHLRHESRDTIYAAIKAGTPAIMELSDIQRNVFTLCWKHNPRDRKSLDHIQSYLTSIAGIPLQG